VHDRIIYMLILSLNFYSLLVVLCRFANKQEETLPNFGGLRASKTP
jgi:hypothetical protein